MQLVVLRAVMMEAMMLPIIWRMAFHVSLFFIVFVSFLFSKRKLIVGEKIFEHELPLIIH